MMATQVDSMKIFRESCGDHLKKLSPMDLKLWFANFRTANFIECTKCGKCFYPDTQKEMDSGYMLRFVCEDCKKEVVS